MIKYNDQKVEVRKWLSGTKAWVQIEYMEGYLKGFRVPMAVANLKGATLEKDLKALKPFEEPYQKTEHKKKKDQDV